MRNLIIYMSMFVSVLMFSAADAHAQVDKKDVRRGNRDFKKENYREAEIDYRKALVKDSLSLAANYNLASTLYREGDYAQAQQILERVKEVAPITEHAADYYFNLGDAALQQKDYQKAVEAFTESLLRNPGDLQAKENFIYAKKMLQDQQQNQQNQQNQNDDQSQNDQNDQNQNEGQNDQNQNEGDDNQDKNDQKDEQDQNNDQNQNDQNNDRQNQNGEQDKQQGEQPKISPQAAQQMLQAIQAKEKETQDKVNRQKAEALKSRQKEKNW